ncbi:hypothetical protein EDB19DRAFT_1979150, partial [Suillus lakei]
FPLLQGCHHRCWGKEREERHQRRFFIPKLELLQSFCGTVQRLGLLMQFSADVTERLLITHCKDLFNRMSRQSKDFGLQCVRILNRQESMEIFDLSMLLHSRGASLVNAIHAEDEDVTTTNPALSWVSQVLPDEAKSVHGPRPVHNHFLKGILSGDTLTTFQLNVTPDYKSLSLVEIHTKYSLPDLDIALADFIHNSSQFTGEHTHWDTSYATNHNAKQSDMYKLTHQATLSPLATAIPFLLKPWAMMVK